MVQEVDFTKLQSNPVLKHFNILSETEEIEREILENFGYQE